MRGRQGEIYRGGCASSRAIVPYNSEATRTTILDSSVGRHPASRPHQKSTPTCHARRDSSRVRQKNGLVLPKFTCSLIIVYAGRPHMVSGLNKSAVDATRVRCPGFAQPFLPARHGRQSARERGGTGSTGQQAKCQAREARAGSHLGACVEHQQREGRRASPERPHGKAFEGPSSK